MPFGGLLSAGVGAVGVIGNVIGGIFGASAAQKAAATQLKADQTASTAALATNAAVNPTITAAAQSAAAGNATATTAANSLIDPYAQSGAAANATLAAGTAPGGQFDTMPTAQQIQMDPGYAARLAASETVMDRSAAARGGAESGTEAMALNNYAQTDASNEYQAAFNRFETSTQNNFSNVNAVAGRGASAATQEGQNLVSSADYGGNLNVQATNQVAQNTIGATNASNNYLTGGAAASAAGTVGAANAVNGAISGSISSIAGAGALYNNLQNPYSSGYGYTTPGGVNTGIPNGGNPGLPNPTLKRT